MHLDVTDAVNLSVHTINRADVAAIWHIFPYECNDRIRRYLRAKDPRFEREQLAPILSQSVYLSPSMLVELECEYDVHPWVIHQKVGHMVLIPAGCAHQVLAVSLSMFVHLLNRS